VVNKRGINIHGFLIIDKPSGERCAPIMNALRKRLHPRKLGYVGTLDEFASGVLPFAFGHATRLNSIMHDRPKTYRAHIEFGKETTTYDRMGDIIAESAEVPDTRAITKVIRSFIKTYEQYPPMYSSKKINGRRASDLVRAGEKVELPPKRVTIHSIEIEKIEFPECIITIECSIGTYIRSLAFDIGRALGCGAYVKELRRLSAGSFSIEQAIAPGHALLEDILPLDEALSFLPTVIVHENYKKNIMNGMAIEKSWIESGISEGICRVMILNKLFAIGEWVNDRWHYKQVFN